MLVKQVLIGAVAGVVFGLYGYFTKAHQPGKGYEKFKVEKIIRTVVIYAAAGALVGFKGQQITQGNIAAATTATVVLGEIVDKLWSRLMRGK